MEDFEIIYVDGVIVIAVNLIRSTINEAKPFRKIVVGEINSGHTKLVIDLSKCDYIDSTFFGAIVVGAKMLIGLDFKLKVVEPTIVGDYIFTYSDYRKVFDKYETREEAILSFEEDIQPES